MKYSLALFLLATCWFNQSLAAVENAKLLTDLETLSAQDLLAKAISFTEHQPNLHGFKQQLTIKNSPNESKEFFQKQIGSDIFIRKHSLLSKFSPTSNCYDLADGRYYEFGSMFVKLNCEELSDYQKRLAAQIGSQAYEKYELKTNISVGTNLCLVVIRYLGPELSKGLLGFLKKESAHDLPQKNTTTSEEFYIRKNDLIVLGYLGRNSQGDLLVDELYESVNTTEPIPIAVMYPQKNTSDAVVCNSRHEYDCNLNKALLKGTPEQQLLDAKGEWKSK